MKMVSVYLFSDEGKMVHSHVVSSCGWCVVEAKVKHLLALPPLCCRAVSFWVGGPYAVCESAYAPTQKRQALLLSQPLNCFRSLPERRHQDQDETEVMMRLHPVCLRM